ncbi:hypothetical protein Pmar_PMAR006593 [Perkinsus marinus ATCC 50983]|uniref:Galactose mutarotase N-terminal barrel domain-containing protein n=1 Tax=Perkinsus marinus (strain ATCC 50983 / TXsc) TaxID=423536 RepID=C5LLP9_PERM5|nr:hypothetical protein Pmar_PMAR006593 [Perkinsus marinus ATCC 50983]EER02271.1 hypothetical protein Pmar_PMAR006593 [Perkinsus marinus ATCC 50983]|eukprot:XP_002769553.1 hypothetical protein Pmar_PMAR006593 [Perkinsus marinus ATCC 50983]
MIINILLVIAGTMAGLTEANYKYYCNFADDLSAKCLGKYDKYSIRVISEHKAIESRRRSRDLVEYVTEVCPVGKAVEGGAQGSLQMSNEEQCDIPVLRGATIKYDKTPGSKLLGRSTTYNVFYPDDQGLARSGPDLAMSYRFDILKPIPMAGLDLSHSSPGTSIFATFTSHKPQRWKVELISHPVLRVEAKFYLEEPHSRFTELKLIAVDNGIMKLTYTGLNNTSAPVQAFFFRLPSKEPLYGPGPYYGVMITYKTDPIMLFDKRMPVNGR